MKKHVNSLKITVFYELLGAAGAEKFTWKYHTDSGLHQEQEFEAVRLDLRNISISRIRRWLEQQQAEGQQPPPFLLICLYLQTESGKQHQFVISSKLYEKHAPQIENQL